MSRIFVRPAPGLKIRNPDTKMLIPDSGEHVVKNSFWIRRIQDGDVVTGEPKPEAKEVKAEVKSEKKNLKQGDK